MNSISRTLATGLCLTALSSFAAYADGVDPMFDANGSYIDEIEIIDDVTLPSGGTYAMLLMEDQHLKFFVDPDAIYVMMDENNPIIVQKTPFYGFWVSTQSVDIADWPACAYEVQDEHGTPFQAHGTLTWTNTGIAENGYELAFTIDLGTCGDAQQPWAFSRAAIEMSGLSGVPHDDIEPEWTHTVVEADGEEYVVELGEYGATLTSVNLREIVVAIDDTTNEVVTEHEVFGMHPDCTASSWYYGIGTWSWANGGFIVGFDDVGFSFPRQDAPVDDESRCRM